MSRIRTIKPEFWTSEQIISCSLQARLLFIGLWNFADDHGVHPASIVRLKAEIFPSDPCSNDDVKGWVGELIRNGLLHKYSVEDKSYWLVTSWKSHQRIDKPTYKYPLPLNQSLSSVEDTLVKNSMTPPRVLDDYSPTTRRVIDESSTTEWKGMEGNGKEKNICKVADATLPLSVIEKDVSADTITSSASKDVQTIFSYWKDVMEHPQAKLDRKRRGKIEGALKLGYRVEQLKQAIDGCARTPFNMGFNDRSQKYDGIDLIFRDAEHIERFILASSQPIPSAPINSSNPIFAGVI